MKTNLSDQPGFYASLVFNSSDLISILSPEGIYEYVSNSSKAILGYAPEELVGKSAFDYIHPEDVHTAANALQALSEKPTIHIPPFRFRASNGNWHWLDCVLKDMTADENVNGIVSNARDVTDKITAEQRLKMRKAYYSSLFTNHPDAVFSLNPEGQFETANHGVEPILGLPLAKIIGRYYFDFVRPGYFEVAAQAFQHAINGQPSKLELEVESKTQGAVWLQLTIIPVIMEGKIMGVHGIGKDITHIKKAQNTIKKQAELLSSVFSSITEGFFVLDKQWHILHANPYFVTFFGLQITPFKNRELWEILPDLKLSRFYQACLEAAGSGRTAYLHEYFPDRQQIIQFAIYPFPDGLSVYFDDVTQQKKQEQELFDLSLVASRITNGVVIMNAKGKIEWVNDAFCNLTGYSRQEAIGKVPSKLLQGPATDPEVSDQILKLYASQTPFSQEILNYKKNGEKIWFHIDVTPVFDEAGQLIKYVAIENDITALKHQEAERLKLTKNLMRRNEDLQQFTYIVSHNLRAPVANLLGLCQLLNTENRFSEKFGQALPKISAAARHLDMVIGDLNKILSPLKDTASATQELVNIYDTVNTVTAGLQEQLSAIEAQLENQLSPDLCIRGNSAYFYSIFNNLLTNAIKYRDEKKKLKITINQTLETQKITLKFADNGIGMAMDRVKPQLFQLYKRFHAGSEGRGIGLYLVKTQTEAMGGSISVKSIPGTGTTFCLTFIL